MLVIMLYFLFLYYTSYKLSSYMAEAEADVFLTDLIHCKEEIVRRLEEIERRVSERKQILLAEIARIQERYEKTLEARRAVQK